MNITTTSKAPANSYTLTVKIPKLRGEEANAAVWNGVDRLESAKDTVKNATLQLAVDSVQLAKDHGNSVGEQIGRTLKFGVAGGIPLLGLKFGKQVKAAINEGKVNNSGATNWANAAMGAGQLTGIGMAALAVGSMFTGIGSPSTLLTLSAVGFGTSAVGAAVLANTTTPAEIAVKVGQGQ